MNEMQSGGVLLLNTH